MFFRFRASLVLAILLVTAFAAGCGPPAPEPPRTDAPQAVSVVVATATERPMPIDLSTIGNVLPVTSVTVRSRVTGVLERVHFTEGETAELYRRGLVAGGLLFSQLITLSITPVISVGMESVRARVRWPAWATLRRRALRPRMP